jgi:hypothetical protein
VSDGLDAQVRIIAPGNIISKVTLLGDIEIN